MLKTPPLQTATATIDTLCSRLQSATLLEDRRGAILGLRSFAKQYPASVASGSLRELITILRRDGVGDTNTRGSRDAETRRSEEGGDVDTTRLVLETLLSLFNPDSSSPEASEEIELYMADEFSMRQDNITLLLSLLDPDSSYADYYSRLYSVQLLSAICASRPERLQECILNAPLGFSRLVSVLDDGREAVRNAGLLLLVDLTSAANEDLKKIVAFEDVFGKVFALIRMEGGLAEAGITAQDCLTLMANLIRNSASNQTMFRESGCVSQMAQLLLQAFPPTNPEAPFMTQNRGKAAWGLLKLLGLFLAPGEASTAQNQQALFRAGTAQVVIDLGFLADLAPPVRILALNCAAALIASNAPLQEAFANLMVELSSAAAPSSQPPAQLNGSRSAPNSARGSARVSAEKPRIHVIEALLDLTLSQTQAELSLRAASCSLIQAYLTKHDRIKAHFMHRAIMGHSERETAPNVLLTLLHSETDTSAVVFASWIVSDLIADEPEAKTALAALSEGNESEGEDMLTSIQTFGTQLQETLQQDPDVRRVAAYAGLLVLFLWDNAEGVNNLLAEGSGLLQALVVAISSATNDPVTVGLAATLLGTIYEFSTKDSPIPRRTLAPLVTQKVGRAKYLDALVQLRRQPAIRDFDVDEVDEGEKLLSAIFIELFTVEYSRLRKAVDKDPGVEVLPPSVAEAGVDRDVLDDLRQQIQASKNALVQAQQDALTEGQHHDNERMTATKDLQTANAEVGRLRKINQAMQQGHEIDLQTLTAKHDKEKGDISNGHQRNLNQMRQDTERQGQNAIRERETHFAENIQDYERRMAEIGNAHRAEQSGHAQTKQQLEFLTAKHAEMSNREESVSQQFEALSTQHGKIQREHGQLQLRVPQLSADLETARNDAETRRDEVKRLTTQLSELKDELSGKENELATERAGFEDLEKELETSKIDLTNARKELDTSQKQLEAAKKLASSSLGKGKTSLTLKDGEKVAELEKELKEAREGEKSAKEELESMLLVMGDIEAKKDEYRVKVKGLGGDVSEEEDDEDEEEEEEENGDDVD